MGWRRRTGLAGVLCTGPGTGEGVGSLFPGELVCHYNVPECLKSIGIALCVFTSDNFSRARLCGGITWVMVVMDMLVLFVALLTVFSLPVQASALVVLKGVLLLKLEMEFSGEKSSVCSIRLSSKHQHQHDFLRTVHTCPPPTFAAEASRWCSKPDRCVIVSPHLDIVPHLGVKSCLWWWRNQHTQKRWARAAMSRRYLKNQ